MKFVVSCENNCDLKRSWLEQSKVPYICTRRIQGGKEYSDCFDSDKEYDEFYETIKKGEMPTTSAINPFEYKEFFEKVRKENPNLPIVHVALSSGLSNACQNGITASKEVKDVTVIDSLAATLVIGELVEKLVELRDKGTDAKTAIEFINDFKMHQQTWVIVSDLFHLKRGGRIKPTAAVIGAVLNIRPIIHISQKGKLAVENKERGNIRAVKYILSRIEKYGNLNENKQGGLGRERPEIWVGRTSNSELYELLRTSIQSSYPNAKIRTGVIGSVIGTHVGCGAVGVLFHGAKRLDIE